MASYRHLARIAVLQTMFAYEFRRFGSIEDLRRNCHEFSEKIKDLSFAESLFNGILKKRKRIHKIIAEFAPEWPINRIALVDLAVLDMGVYEILYSEDVPPVVAINEAVEIAKLFGDLNSGKFINGVLSGVMKKYVKKKSEKNRAGKKNNSGKQNS